MKKAGREPGLPVEFVLIVDASTSVVIEKRMSAGYAA
jgi:Mg-chelatase subunit ChlD